MLQTFDLTKRFGKFTAVNDVNLDVRSGEIFGFLGPNGAGKSTTIRMVLDLIRPSNGRVELFGRHVRKRGADLRANVGYLPGELALYENLSARQLFMYSASLYGVDDIQYGLDLAERLKVTSVDARIGSLSAGNKQKIGIVQALLHKPRLAILDEPTNALDPLVRREVYGILGDAAAEGMTVFFSSHVLAEAERICDRVAIIRDGELTRVGTVEELKALSPRRMRFTFAGDAPLEELERIPGVSEVVHSDGPNTVDLLVRDNMDEIVQVASRHTVTDFYSDDITLEEVFMGYYGETTQQPVAAPDPEEREETVVEPEPVVEPVVAEAGALTMADVVESVEPNGDDPVPAHNGEERRPS